jgi:uncharacterized membrane protein
MIGNIILGTVFGVLIRLKWNIILAVLTSYLIQLPWLYLTDVYLVHMPVKVVQGVIIALLFSNILWAVVAKLSYKKIRNLA